ncbi:MAG: glycerophosphodiester phosphodiesterase family protein [Actinomycetota bacterium]
MASRPLAIIGHRGAARYAPENTMASFRRALNLGASGFEFDVHLTGDGEPIVIHDPTLDRTTSGSGAVMDATMADLRSLDAGTWFGPEFQGERLPGLADVLQLPAKIFELEIKASGTETLDAVVAAVDRAGVIDHGADHPDPSQHGVPGARERRRWSRPDHAGDRCRC